MDSQKNIELELRAEIPISDFDKVLESASKKGSLKANTKRLSVMFLGSTDSHELYLRIRINNKGKTEIVLKKGDLHTHDRLEVSQIIEKDQFMGMVKIFSNLGFKSKVTERENFSFDFGDDVSFEIVRSKNIAYVEIEKMSSESDAEDNKSLLSSILNEMSLPIINTREEFDNLCSRLSNNDDWEFLATKEDFEKLSLMLNNY